MRCKYEQLVNKLNGRPEVAVAAAAAVAVAAAAAVAAPPAAVLKRTRTQRYL